MCRQCLVLGALLNAGGDNFPTEALSVYDARSSANFVDPLADSYLRTCLRKFTEHGIDLIPVTVTSDGSCLPHAISRALVGTEIFYDCLRADLFVELRDNEQWYKAHLPLGHHLDDEAWRGEWDTIVAAAEPTHGQRAGLKKFLEGVHILGLANVLKRPILLIDQADCMKAICSMEVNGCGMYLPLRFSRANILQRYNRIPGPILIGWQTRTRNHYVSIMLEKSSNIIDGLPKNASTDYEGVKQWNSFFNSLETLKPLDEILVELLINLCVSTHAIVRDRIFSTIYKLLDGIRSYADNPTLNDRFRTIKYTNTFIKYNIISYPTAIEILLLSGFEELEIEGVVCLQYPSKLSLSTVPRITSIMNILDIFNNEAGLKGRNYPGLAAVPGDAAHELFGPSPLVPRCVDDSQNSIDMTWQEAVQEYGEGSIKTGYVWCIGGGDNGSEVVSAMIDKAKKTFGIVTHGNFGRWTHVYNQLSDASQAAVVRCPVCLTDAQWPIDPTANGPEQLDILEEHLEPVVGGALRLCPTCYVAGRCTYLSITETLSLRVMRAVRTAFASATSTWRCTAYVFKTCAPSTATRNDYKDSESHSLSPTVCGVANLQSSEYCLACQAPAPHIQDEDVLEDALNKSFGTNTSSAFNSSFRSNYSRTLRDDSDSEVVDALEGTNTESEFKSTTGLTLWSCKICTFKNHFESDSCAMCLSGVHSVPWHETVFTSEGDTKAGLADSERLEISQLLEKCEEGEIHSTSSAPSCTSVTGRRASFQNTSESHTSADPPAQLLPLLASEFEIRDLPRVYAIALPSPSKSLGDKNESDDRNRLSMTGVQSPINARGKQQDQQTAESKYDTKGNQNSICVENPTRQEDIWREVLATVYSAVSDPFTDASELNLNVFYANHT